MKPTRPRSKPEPTIALINIVFLMLIFFLIAGTLSQPVNPQLRLVKTSDLDMASPPDGLIIHADGRMLSGGQPVDDLAAFADIQDTSTIRLIPDRDLPARTLLQVAASLQAAGADKTVIATERALR